MMNLALIDAMYYGALFIFFMIGVIGLSMENGDEERMIQSRRTLPAWSSLYFFLGCERSRSPTLDCKACLVMMLARKGNEYGHVG